MSTVSSETLLFEPLGEMISGLSYIHTVIPINILNVEKQILQYQATLNQDLSGAHLKHTLLRTLQEMNAEDATIQFEHTSLQAWEKIAALHKDRAQALLDRFQVIKGALPKVALEDDVEHTSESYAYKDDMPEWVRKPLDTSGPLTRERRALPALLGAAGIFFGLTGTLFGSLSMSRTKNLAFEVAQLTSNVEALTSGVLQQAEKLQSHGDSIALLSTQMLEQTNRLLSLEDALTGLSSDLDTITTVSNVNQRFDSAVLSTRLDTHHAMVEGRLYRLESLLQQLHHHRLAINFLDEPTVLGIYNRISSKAKKVGYQILLEVPSELYQVEVTHFFNGTHLNMVLHVPVAPEDGRMRLFRLHPFPLPFSNGTFLVPNVKHDVLAVSNQNHRHVLQLSTVDLIGCHKINSIYLCERNGAVNKYPEDTCLGALYHQKFSAAKRLCQFSLEPAREYVYPLLNNWFLIHLLEPLTVALKCANGTQMEWYLRVGVTKQYLPAGCSADFPRYKLLSDISVLLPSEYVQINMDWDPLSFMPEMQAEIMPAFTRLKRAGAESVSLPVLQSLIASGPPVPFIYHKTHFVFNLVAGLCAIALVGGVMYKVMQRIRKSTEIRNSKMIDEAVRNAMLSQQTISAPAFNHEVSLSRTPSMHRLHPTV